MQNAVFYHAGCPVCVSAEQDILNLIDSSKVNVEIVHLGEQKNEVVKAASQGVKSVPALLMPSGNVLHLNFGASLDDLKV
jgi:glutaredoxin 3